MASEMCSSYLVSFKNMGQFFYLKEMAIFGGTKAGLNLIRFICGNMIIAFKRLKVNFFHYK